MSTATMPTFRPRPGVVEIYEYTLADPALTYRWDVVRLQRRASGRPVERVPLTPFVEQLLDGRVEIDARRVLTDPSIDPDLPLLAVPLPWPSAPDGSPQHLIVDGWHRLARAWADGRAEMRIVVFGPEDERACRLSPSEDELLAALRDTCGAVCDICRSDDVRWRYPARDFAMEPLGMRSVGDWTVCEPCAALVETRDLASLERCGREAYEQIEGRPLTGEPASAGHVFLAMFLASIDGPRRPHWSSLARS